MRQIDFYLQYFQITIVQLCGNRHKYKVAIIQCRISQSRSQTNLIILVNTYRESHDALNDKVFKNHTSSFISLSSMTGIDHSPLAQVAIFL